MQQAPGLPCALYFEEGQTKMQTSGAMRRENANAHSAVIARLDRTIQYAAASRRHCERSEAIHLSVHEVTMDCFAALAMTA